jgi:hypothetical protein
MRTQDAAQRAHAFVPLAGAYDPKLPGVSPERVAAALKVQMLDVARLAAVHRNTLTRTPNSSKVQGRLGDVSAS